MARFRTVTRAILWYPLAAAIGAGAFAAWAWSDCGKAHDPPTCRADVPTGALWFFLAILVAGLLLLVVLSVLTSLVGGLRSRGRASGFEGLETAPPPVPPPERPDARSDAETARPVVARRADRHR